MIHLSIRRLKPDHRAMVEGWLTEVNEQHRDQAIATLVDEGVTHETAAILDTADGPLLVYAMETEDVDRARAVGAATCSDIDRRNHEVMRRADAGSASFETVLDLVAPRTMCSHPKTATEPRIRNIAVGLIVRDRRALVEVYPETERHGTFARAIGGGIGFGEAAVDAVRREFIEELSVDITRAMPLTVTENRFELGGRPRHEIVHVFEVDSPQLDSLPFDAEVTVLDNDTTVRWIALDALRADDPPFYPDSIIDIASSLNGAR